MEKEELFRPSELSIQARPNNGFIIIADEDQSKCVLEFRPSNSPLTTEQAMEFAQYLIDYYNHNYS